MSALLITYTVLYTVCCSLTITITIWSITTEYMHHPTDTRRRNGLSLVDVIWLLRQTEGWARGHACSNPRNWFFLFEKIVLLVKDLQWIENIEIYYQQNKSMHSSCIYTSNILLFLLRDRHFVKCFYSMFYYKKPKLVGFVGFCILFACDLCPSPLQGLDSHLWQGQIILSCALDCTPMMHISSKPKLI